MFFEVWIQFYKWSKILHACVGGMLPHSWNIHDGIDAMVSILNTLIITAAQIFHIDIFSLWDNLASQ